VFGRHTSGVRPSEEISRAFYARLGADGLAARTRPEYDEQIVAALLELLPPDGRVLDVGCGYGRVAIPLAQAGFRVAGLDHADNLLAAARAGAAGAGVEVAFTAGSMTRLPYPDGAFDAALCLWSAFHELLEEDAQVATVAELWRVLAPGGFALVEGPLYAPPPPAEIRSGERRGPDHRVAWHLVEGSLNPHYVHDESSLRRVCASAGVPVPQVFERDWGGRRRLFLRLAR
jgi:SAM-dependent methyltransferase